MNIFLDDVRPCPDGYLVARDYNDFVRLVSDNKDNIDTVSLDYDLDSVRTGFDAAKFLVENKIMPKKICIHSNSTSGVKLIYKYLKENTTGIEIVSLRINISE